MPEGGGNAPPTKSRTEFPLARAAFWPPATASESSDDAPQASEAPDAPRPRLAGARSASRVGLSLSIPSLGALKGEDGPASEMQLRREKLAHFDKQCTRLADGLFVGSDTVARDRAALAAAGVTHVLNATAHVSRNYFAPRRGAEAEDGGPPLCYKALWLQDTPGEDLCCVLYDVFDWLEACRAAGGVALVHCSQGVSRSVALCIAYLMWRDGGGYDDAFARVKAARGVANPNMGFACQLLQWAKRRGGPPDAPRLYRIAPHSAADPRLLLPRQVSKPQVAALDARGAFVLHAREGLFVWRGAACAPPFAAAAAAAAEQLVRYEGAAGPARHVECGAEPPVMLDALGVPPEARGADGAGLLDAAALRCAAYDESFEQYAAGRRCEAALRAGAGAQEQEAAAAEDGVARLLPRPGSASSAPRFAPRMSTPVLYAPPSGVGASLWGAMDPPAATPRHSMHSSGWGDSPRVSGTGSAAPSVAASPRLSSAVGAGPPPVVEEAHDAPQLYEFPSLERLHLFDSDDLLPSGAFLLLSREGSVHVWLGAQHTQSLAPGDEPHAAAARVAATAAAGGVPVPAGAPVLVELAGSESTAFWDAFRDG